MQKRNFQSQPLIKKKLRKDLWELKGKKKKKSVTKEGELHLVQYLPDQELVDSNGLYFNEGLSSVYVRELRKVPRSFQIDS